MTLKLKITITPNLSPAGTTDSQCKEFRDPESSRRFRHKAHLHCAGIAGQRNSKEPWSCEEPPKAARSREEPRGAARSREEPRGAASSCGGRAARSREEQQPRSRGGREELRGAASPRVSSRFLVARLLWHVTAPRSSWRLLAAPRGSSLLAAPRASFAAPCGSSRPLPAPAAPRKPLLLARSRRRGGAARSCEKAR